MISSHSFQKLFSQNNRKKFLNMADNDKSERSFSANSDDDGYEEEEEVDRDEVKEVRKLSSKDTTRIRFWRLIVTLVLLLTAFAVTFTTYTFLERQEHENFVTAVRKGLCFNSNACVHHTMYHPIVSFAKYLMLQLIQMTLFGIRIQSVCTILPNGW
jgi:hypothetical protein